MFSFDFIKLFLELFDIFVFLTDLVFKLQLVRPNLLLHHNALFGHFLLNSFIEERLFVLEFSLETSQ